MDRARLTSEKAIALVRAAGGVAVLAHPVTLNLKAEELDAFIGSLAAQGLSGMECYYSEHSAEQSAEYLAIAKKYDLVPTGGSDFHGKPGCRLELESGIRGLFQPDGKEGTCYLCNGVLALEVAESLEDLETGWAALRLVDATVENGRAVVDFVFYDGEPAPDALFLRPSIRSSVPKN